MRSYSLSPQQSGEGDWEFGEDTQRRATFPYSGEGRGGEDVAKEHSPVLLRRETVGEGISAESTAAGRVKVRIYILSSPHFHSHNG